MIRRDYQSIGDVLRQILSDAAMDSRLNEVKAEKAWPVIVGTHIAEHCSRPRIANGVMTVRIRNAALRQELNMVRSSLIRAINDYVGSEVVTEIRLGL